MAKILKSTKDMQYNDWLDLRKKSIGGSDAAVIMGLNPYKSTFTLWAEKKGLVSDKEDNEAMRIGRDLEEYVARRFCEATGKKVRRRNAMFVHKDYDFITANIDREVVGENAGLECKTTNMFNKSDFEGGEIPLYYYCQCMHYMAVMGYEKMYLAVLVLGKAFYWYEIERDENEIESLISKEVDWWNDYILKDQKPELDGSDSSGDTLNEMYPKDQGTTIYDSSLKEKLELYLKLKAECKAMEKSKDEYEQAIKAAMGDAENCVIGKYKASWKYQTRVSLDGKKLRAEMPEVYAKYSKQTEYRKFSVK